MAFPLSRRQVLRMCGWTVLAAVASSTLHAQEAYPSKPIHLIVPFGAGGATDTVARILAAAMQQSMKATIVVDNKEGASGMIGTALVAKARPDGYTLLFTTNAHIMNSAIRKTVSYDAVADFTPLAKIASSPLLLVVNASSPFKSVSEYVATAKSHPNTVTFASSGVGTSPHIAAAQLTQATGATFVHVPYNVSSAQTRAVVAGDVASSWSGVYSMLPYMKTGRIRALAVASDRRSTIAPEVPTLTELGIKGVTVDTWFAVMAPASLPTNLRDRLTRAISSAMQLAEIKERLASIGAEVSLVEGAAFGELVNAEYRQFKKLAADSHISVD